MAQIETLAMPTPAATPFVTDSATGDPGISFPMVLGVLLALTVAVFLFAAWMRRRRDRYWTIPPY